MIDAEYDSVRTVELLLAAKANPTQVDGRGQSAISIASNSTGFSAGLKRLHLFELQAHWHPRCVQCSPAGHMEMG